MLQFGVSLTDDTRSINYDRNMFIIQATDVSKYEYMFVYKQLFTFLKHAVPFKQIHCILANPFSYYDEAIIVSVFLSTKIHLK